MPKLKPFDLLVIEAPYEYGPIIPEQTVEGLKNLADICRSNNIPIRVSNRDPNNPKDNIVKCLSDCDYADYESSILSNLGVSSERISIMLTGGILDYTGQKCCQMAIEQNPQINQSEIANFDIKDTLRQYVFIAGCISGAAHRLYKEIKVIGKEPEIYIDPLSSIRVMKVDLIQNHYTLFVIE